MEIQGKLTLVQDSVRFELWGFELSAVDYNSSEIRGMLSWPAALQVTDGMSIISDIVRNYLCVPTICITVRH